MLTIRNLTHTYPNGVHALKNVNLNIENGLFGLLGPNGAGKSTLIRTIATLQSPSSGEIQFGSVNVLTQAGELRRVLGYLPQEFGVYPRGSASQTLNHLALLKGITNKNERKQIVEKLLMETNLFEHRSKRLATFSGGMLQRFGIAQVLIGNPKLIIVDEPTAGLDPEERRRFYNLLSEVGEEIVVLLSTHIVEDVSVLCRNVAIMFAGEIAAQGTPSELISELKGEIWETEIDRAGMKSFQNEHNVLSSHLISGRIIVRVNSAVRPSSSFVQVPPNLEDAYFSAAKKSHRSNLILEKNKDTH